MQENRRRMTHLEGAVRHLGEETGDLAWQCNALRQEKFIEEIEVILLSSANINDGSSSPFPRALQKKRSRRAAHGHSRTAQGGAGPQLTHRRSRASYRLDRVDNFRKPRTGENSTGSSANGFWQALYDCCR